jgi:release factor glutamine methyltransferase
MKNSKLVMKDLMARMTLDDGHNEKESIGFLIMEHLFGISRTHIMQERDIQMTPVHESIISKMIDRLNRHEPVQYILGETDFFGRNFSVTPSVLIPRPETEQLIVIVKDFQRNIQQQYIRILDIGTGSGCIPITLALEIPGSNITAIDVDTAALEVAKKNAERYRAFISLQQSDILKDDLQNTYDVIVSNPPYIAEEEKKSMQKNVLDFEPHIALFVPDNDPLIFYKQISRKSFKALTAGGLLALEINERFGDEVASLLKTDGFKTVTIIKDINKKARIVTGVKPSTYPEN